MKTLIFSSYRVYVQQLSNSEIVQTKTLGTKYMCNQHRILLKDSWEPLFCDNIVRYHLKYNVDPMQKKK